METDLLSIWRSTSENKFKINPEISIVIPTHNRCKMLCHVLDALCRQTASPQSYEVIVVADGCNDGTIESVKRLFTPYPLIMIEQSDSGPASARNQGAKAASSPLLLFLDDDVVPERELVRAHLIAHKRWPKDVILGYTPFLNQTHQNNFAYIEDKMWWSNLFANQQHKEHRFSCDDLTTANISINLNVFEEVGKFDESFHVCEDTEFGFRCLKRHVRFHFVQEAVARHHAYRPEKNYFQRNFNMGRAHVAFIRKHPNIVHVDWIPIGNLGITPNWIYEYFSLDKIAFKILWLNQDLAKFLSLWLRFLLYSAKICKNRKWYTRFLAKIYAYQYWSGVKVELGSLAAAKQLAQEAYNLPIDFTEVRIDLKTDFDRLDEILNRLPADAVSLFFGNLYLGRISQVVGLESLRPIHIYKVLIHLIKNNLGTDSIEWNSAELANESFLPSIKPEDLTHLIKSREFDKLIQNLNLLSNDQE